MLRRRLFLMAVLVAIPLASARAQEEAPVFLTTGVVVLVGHAPQVRVSFIEEGSNRTFELSGDLLPELKALGGIKLCLTALPPDQPSRQEPAATDRELPARVTLSVTAYRIVDVGGGIVPVTGVITRDPESRLILKPDDGREPLVIVARGALLRLILQSLGAKVWMVGAAGEDGLHPTRMQIIIKRAAPAAADTATQP